MNQIVQTVVVKTLSQGLNILKLVGDRILNLKRHHRYYFKTKSF